jgi:hypothetical protein
MPRTGRCDTRESDLAAEPSHKVVADVELFHKEQVDVSLCYGWAMIQANRGPECPRTERVLTLLQTVKVRKVCFLSSVTDA